MKIIIKITFCLAFVMLLTSFANAQTKTLKGYLCGNEFGNAAGTYYLRVGKKVVEVGYQFSSGAYGQWGKNTEEYGMRKKNSGKTGAEYFVKYKVFDGYIMAQTITFTGKLNKNIKPCSTN